MHSIPRDLQTLQVAGFDALSHKLGLLDRSKKVGRGVAVAV